MMKNEKRTTRMLLVSAENSKNWKVKIRIKPSEVVRIPILPISRARMRTNPIDAKDAMSG